MSDETANSCIYDLDMVNISYSLPLIIYDFKFLRIYLLTISLLIEGAWMLLLIFSLHLYLHSLIEQLSAYKIMQEIHFAEEQIQSSDALLEMSLGHWEGCPCSEIYTPEVLSLIESFQPDFCAPSGESLRQVEFRMVQFLNRTILGLPEKLRSDFTLNHQIKSQGFSHDRDPSGPLPQQWDMLHRHRPGLSRKKSGRSRLQYVTATGNHEGDNEISPREANDQSAVHNPSARSSTSISSCIGIFTHSIPIKCLLTGILGCSPVMLNKICIEDSSVTVLLHSWRTGWQIKRLNDTAHLRLL